MVMFSFIFWQTQNRIYKFIERRLAKKSSKIIAISEIQKQELVDKYKICTEEQTEVIPLGFDLSRFQTDQQEKEQTSEMNGISIKMKLP